jgi:predicted transcriptional regulator
MISNFLDVIDLKPVSRKVLLDIVEHGVSSVAEISSRLHTPKSTVYDALSPLIEKSLINEYATDERGKTFGISEPEQLTRVHGERIEELKKAQIALLEYIKHHKPSRSIAQPKIKFYAGTLGIKQAFRDMPWTKDHKETYLLWATNDMISIDEEFFKWHGTQRFQHKVFMYAIEKHEDRKLQTKKHEWLKADSKTNAVEVRYLPKGTDWKMSYWIYGDKVLFSSGGEEKIAFTVHSKEFSQMMKLMWQNTWNNAKK